MNDDENRAAAAKKSIRNKSINKRHKRLEMMNIQSANLNGCIFCCSCVKNCLTQAGVFEASPIKEGAETLSKNCRDRKELEIFL
jgi:NAD-dependent dihydropyrimidine dehydrogenase PreA subunit